MSNHQCPMTKESPMSNAQKVGRDILTGWRTATGLVLLSSASLSFAQTTNGFAGSPPLPDVGFSALRVLGSLVLLLALFLAGVWLFKNWQRVAIYKGRDPKLNILEIKSLGNRHALYLVAYEQQRFLLSSSPAGINLITHLPEADGQPAAPLVPSFAQNLQQLLR